MKSKNISGKYIWQDADWPNFKWDSEKLLEPMARLNMLHGQLYGKMYMLGFQDKIESVLSAMTEELTSSSCIEGILLNHASVRRRYAD